MYDTESIQRFVGAARATHRLYALLYRLNLALPRRGGV